MKFSITNALVAPIALALILAAPAAHAQVSSAGFGLFPVGPAQVTFDGLSDGTELNGATVGGVTFSYSLGNGQIVASGGPGNTNTMTALNLVSIGDDSGVLTLTLPDYANLFGFGYALLGGGTILNAATVTAFDGATNLGSLSYAGDPDPVFPGGFAGLQSVSAFNRLELTFNSTAASAFAADNFRFSSNVVPEPTSFMLFAVGLGGIALVGRRRATSERRGRTAEQA